MSITSLARKPVLIAIVLLLVACKSAPSPTHSSLPPISLSPAPPTLAPSPVVTPNGPLPNGVLSSLQIAFVKNQALWLWKAGSISLVASEVDEHPTPRLSEDGALIAFSRNGELWSVQIDGSNERLLVSEQFLMGLGTDTSRQVHALLSRIEWLPGTHDLLFSTYVPTVALPTDNRDLHTVNADTQHLQTLLAVGEGGAFFMAPNGQEIAVVWAGQLRLVSADGERNDLLFTQPNLVTQRHQIDFTVDPLWVPDSSALLAVVGPSSLAFQFLGEIAMSAPTVIWRIPTDGSEPEALAEIPTLNRYKRAPGYAISPDGLRLAFLSRSEAGLNAESDFDLYELHLANIDLSDDTLYYVGGYTNLQWMPDSNHFLFSISEDDKKGGPTQLGAVTGGYRPFVYISPRWVDASYFLYTARWNKHEALFLGSIDTPEQPGILLIEELNLYHFVK